MTNGHMFIDRKINDHEHDWHHHHHGYPWCIAWTAIFAGAFVGIGLSFLLNIFNLAIGLSVFSQLGEGGMATLAVGGLIGMLIGTIIVMFLSGLVSGYLGRTSCHKQNLGILYGFLTWVLALILTAIFAAQLGNYISTYSNEMTNPSNINLVVNSNKGAMLTKTQANGTVNVNVEKAVNLFSLSTFIIFILFFVGAVASCIGGYCGMSCKEKECQV